MDIQTLQTRVKRNYERRGFTSDLMTLGLGLCEESGEIAKAINLLNPKYVQAKPNNADSLAHEIADAMIYLVAIANSANIDLDSLMEEKCIYKENS